MALRDGLLPPEVRKERGLRRRVRCKKVTLTQTDSSRAEIIKKCLTCDVKGQKRRKHLSSNNNVIGGKFFPILQEPCKQKTDLFPECSKKLFMAT